MEIYRDSLKLVVKSLEGKKYVNALKPDINKTITPYNALLDVCYSDLYYNRAIEVIHNDVIYRKEREADRSRDMELQAENQALSNHFYFA